MDIIPRFIEFYVKIRSSKCKFLAIIGLLIYFLKGNILSLLPTENSKINDILLILLAILFAVLFVEVNSRLPIASKNKFGIAIAIKTQNNNQLNEINDKLIEPLKSSLESSNNNKFDVITINLNKHVKIKLKTKDEIAHLLKKVKCKFCISIGCIEGKINGDEMYQLNAFNVIMHRSFRDEIQRKFQFDINEVAKYIKVVRIQKSNDLEEFSGTSKELAYICEYIIGVAQYLSQNFNEAINILSELSFEVDKIVLKRESIKILCENVKLEKSRTV